MTFKNSDDLSNVISNDFVAKTMLTEYFTTNKANNAAAKYLYNEFPEYFVWDQQKKIWNPRKQGHVIGRVVVANPTEGERYYLRLLLGHVKGATCFNDLKNVNGIRVESFREAALLHGLLESDDYLEHCLYEASLYQMSYSLRRLFATILVYCNPSNPKLLWSNFENALCDDFVKIEGLSTNQIKVKALQSINSTLESMGKNLDCYGISDVANLQFNDSTSKDLQDELAIIVSKDDIYAASLLNFEQRKAYDAILEKVFGEKTGCFFIDGPGGTGKTFLYRALLATVRSRGFIALATATSGVAASLLPGGRTAHSRFKIPINIQEFTTCTVSKQSALAELLRKALLIIWDEASMARRQAIEALNKLLQDINESALPFGCKVVVFGGDFRQVLPVVPKASREETIDASLLSSTLWNSLEKIRLTQNMRAKFDNSFCDFLLRVGDSKKLVVIDDKIRIYTSYASPLCE